MYTAYSIPNETSNLFIFYLSFLFIQTYNDIHIYTTVAFQSRLKMIVQKNNFHNINHSVFSEIPEPSKKYSG